MGQMEQASDALTRGSLSVLLIEDNADHSALIEGYLRRSRALTLQTAHCLSEGFQRVAADRFDAVLLDLHLPDCQGLATLECAVTRIPDLPIVVLTTIDDEELAIEAVKRGAQDYLTKDNVTAEVLRRSVRYAVERKQIERALRSTEEQLRHSQRMEAMGRVAAGVAHDFNNLLMIINGYSEELLRRLEGDPRGIRQVESIRRAGERGAELTKQLLTFTRMQVSAPEILDFGLLVDETTRMLPPVIGRSIDLRIKQLPGDLHVRADGNQLTQVILNLVVNARDAMPDGGKLTIETGVVASPDPEPQEGSPDRDSGCVYLKVSDTGTGMDPETRARVFEPFFTTKKARGTGLGLSTVFGIVTQFGGHISVESELGHGAVFTIVLPRAKKPPTPAARRKTENREFKVGAGCVLLVDDESSIRELLRDALRREGYPVLEADGGDAALEIAETHVGDIDLLVTDIVMPGLNGYDLAERVASHRPSIKVFYMSGYSDTEKGTSVRLRKHRNYIQKPFPVALFLRKISEILAGQELVGS